MKRVWPLTFVALMLMGLSFLSWNGVLAAPPAQGDLAVITSPQNNAIVRGSVPILGSATHPQFQFYKVEFAREPVTGDNWAIIGAIREQQIVDGQLEAWDTTQVPDGSYSLRLRVVRLDGNYSEYTLVQVVVANAQPTETPTPAASPIPTITPTHAASAYHYPYGLAANAYHRHRAAGAVHGRTHSGSHPGHPTPDPRTGRTEFRPECYSHAKRLLVWRWDQPGHLLALWIHGGAAQSDLRDPGAEISKGR